MILEFLGGLYDRAANPCFFGCRFRGMYIVHASMLHGDRLQIYFCLACGGVFQMSLGREHPPPRTWTL
jgi:hypothetical protein